MIADIDPSLEQISISGLLTEPELPGEDELIGLEDGSPREPEEMGVDDKLLAIEQRLLELEANVNYAARIRPLRCSSCAQVPKEIRRSAEGTIHSSNDPKGWRQLSNKEWRACPIGCWGTL
jgi:nucleotidyltransferase/DNA polymerase involved in DNA repair